MANNRERPTAVRSGNNANEGRSHSESWTRRLATPLGGRGRNESRPRRSSPPSSSSPSSSSDNGNDYQPPTTDARTSSRRTSFDIEQQQQQQQQSAVAVSTKDDDDDNNNNNNNFCPLTSCVPPTSLSSSSSALPPTPDISQSFSTGKSTYTLQSRRHKGFSTPFCGLFTTSGGLPTADHEHPQLHHQEDLNHHKRELQLSHLRTDICSLPCFGILQADHTRYLFTHTRPPTFFKRICTHFITPVTLFLLAGYCAGNIRNELLNSVVCTGLVYCIVIWIVSGCVRGRKKRVMVREEILWRLRRREEKIRKRIEERRERLNLRLDGKGGNNDAPGDGLVQGAESEEYEYYSEDEYEYHRSGYETSLGQTRFEMNCAHRMLGCYPSDIPRDSCCSDGSEADDYVLQQQRQSGDVNPDLCTRIWSCFAKPCLPWAPWCCGDSYGFHPQFCGLCALAQEAREANLTLPRHLRMVDYITMEPFLLYYPRIVELRRSATNSFWAHCRAISALSRTILFSLKVVIVTLLIVSVSSAFGYWELNDMMVLLTTFLQSFAVMYFVHWGWHRYDLSIDAVIKYFACGFVLCTSMAFTVELLEYLAFQGVVMGLVWWLEVRVVDSSGYGGGGMRDVMTGGQRGRSLAAGSDVLEGFLKRNPAARIFYILVSSYLMAGLVEEVCKYFGFVMVDHPDFCSEREMEKAKATMPLQLLRDREEEDDEGEDEPVENEVGSNEKGKPTSSPARVGQAQVEIDAALASFNPAMQRRSLSSIRSGVTVAMVAVALGFACCENILHIFIYNRSSLRSEITTLIVKSLFPVHPIAAAIQSIYVCRRDLEKDPSIGLGRIVLPSVIFHGTYDFVLLLVTSSWQRSNNEAYLGQGNNLTGVAVLSFCASLFMVLAGGLYYTFSSRAQYARLRGGSGSGVSSVLSEASFGFLL